MARARGCQREQVYAQRAFVGSAIGPKGSPRLPIRPQAFIVCHGVLNDESLYALRMRQGHAKTHGAAIILHVKRVAREPERFGEVIHDLGDVIEGVREFLRVRPVAVSEARVIGRNQVIAIGEPGEERLEHSRRRGQAVEQENGRRVLRARFPIKNGEPVNLHRAIKDRLRHGMFPFCFEPGASN